MKILYVITSTETGGAEKALLKLATAVAQKGHEVQVVCLKPLGAVAQSLQKANISVKSIYTRPNLPGRTVQKIRMEINRFKPDLVHAMLFRAIEYTRMACANISVPLMTTPHFDISKKTYLFRLADRALKGRDTLTVAESFSTADYLVRRQHYRKDNVFLLPNSADKTQFFKDEKLRLAMREKQSFHVKTLVFLCVARLAPVKNPVLLLQAFRNVLRTFPEARLVYVGEGAERAKLESFIEQSRMQNSVLLAGEQDNINDWLNMADVFVLPSREESLPLALLEALRVGLPCIVSGVGDMPRWVEHGKNGYVFPPGDITLLSCFMNELAGNVLLRQQMSRASLEKSGCLVDTEKQYEQLYEQVILKSFHVKTNQKE